MRSFAARGVTLVVGSATALALIPTASGLATPSGSLSAQAHVDVASGAPHAAADKFGRWTVVNSGPGAYTATWTSPTRLPYTDARAEVVMDGRPTGPARLSADGRSVSVAVESAVRPTAADFDVLLGGKTLDQRASASESPRMPYRRPAGLKELTVDPGVPGSHDIATSDYVLEPVKLPGLPELAEMVGHVVEPVDATDSSPLVLFLHGVHAPCYVPRHGEPSPFPQSTDPDAWACSEGQIPVPSYLGYDYVQRLLASQGYVTVSISADAITDAAQHPTSPGTVVDGAAARAALIGHHLEQWVQLVSGGDEHADLGNVILVGHSAGGESVNRASLNLPTSAGYRVSGQVLLAPTDTGFQAAPFTPTVTVLPYCDGDVSDLEGQRFTDEARDLTGLIAFHSSILMIGANHNFFNTEWTPGLSDAPSLDDWFGPDGMTCGDDDPARLSAAKQRKVAKAYIAGAVHLFADDDQSAAKLFDGSAVSVPSAGDADVRSHAIGGGRDIRRPGIEATAGDANGASVRLCTGISDAARRSACEPGADSWLTQHWRSNFYRGAPLRQEVEMHWTGPDQTAGIDLAEPFDLSGADHLDLRTIVDPTLGRAKLDVRLVDGAGGSATVTPVGGGVLVPLPGSRYAPSKRWAQTLRVPLEGATGIDLSDIVTIDLISRTPDGRVWILDMSAVPTGGVAEPSGQIPLVSFQSVRQDEGDGPGDATLPIAYHVTGDLAADATVNVHTFEYSSVGLRRDISRELVIPAHTTDGTLEVAYRPNTTADYSGHRRIYVMAYATHGIQTDRFTSVGTLIDDDPVPNFTVTPIAKRVAEGDRAQWRLRLSAPLAFRSRVRLDAVRAVDGKQLTVGDLPKKFRARHFRVVPPLDTPLAKSGLRVSKDVPAGRSSVTIAIPIRRTKSDDGPRSLSLQFELYGVRGSHVSTVTVMEPKR